MFVVTQVRQALQQAVAIGACSPTVVATRVIRSVAICFTDEAYPAKPAFTRRRARPRARRGRRTRPTRPASRRAARRRPSGPRLRRGAPRPSPAARPGRRDGAPSRPRRGLGRRTRRARSCFPSLESPRPKTSDMRAPAGGKSTTSPTREGSSAHHSTMSASSNDEAPPCAALPGSLSHVLSSCDPLFMARESTRGPSPAAKPRPQSPIEASLCPIAG